MAAIGYDDVVYATVTQRGIRLAEMRFSGMTSMEAVIRNMRNLIGSAMGMVTLNVRNMSQGWTQKRSLFVNIRNRRDFKPVQLSLF